MSTRVKLQAFGRFLSGMVMPNIGAFIAWGLITALFIPTGWIPNENLAKLVGPSITYLLPLLIGYTGGKMVGGSRGAVAGAIATMGVIVGAEIPMFLGAMIVGPLGGFAIKKVDEFLEGKVKSGFEMLVNNFSLGIIAGLLSLVALVVIGPAVASLSQALFVIVDGMVKMRVLPLVSIVVEPAKIFFLNNALNHGIFTPLGTQQVQSIGKSLYFLIEANPGPGLGVLLAYYIFGKGMAKESSLGAIIIHFFGGIHEIYFPYVLMNPLLFLAVIAGGATGVLVNVVFNSGLISPASPGSIIAILAVASKDSYLGIGLSVIASTVVSFLISSIFVKSAADNSTEDSFEEASNKVKGLKSSKGGAAVSGNLNEVRSIVVACDAGMGSSAMGASLLKKKVQAAGLNINVTNRAINEIPESADLIITHRDLTDRARQKAPAKQHLSLDNFLDGGFYDNIVEKLKSAGSPSGFKAEEERKVNTNILKKEGILVNLPSESKEAAIMRAGNVLVDLGCIEKDYVDGMLKREKVHTTYLDNGVAIPHGIGELKDSINETGISVLLYPEGIDYGDGNVAKLLIGIAAKNNEHIDIISKIAELVMEEELIDTVIKSNSVEKIYEYLR